MALAERVKPEASVIEIHVNRQFLEVDSFE
jgi:hypothetical protein